MRVSDNIAFDDTAYWSRNLARREGDFADKVILQLKGRVASRCSNPDCRVPTSAPKSNNGENNIGVGAHICAASPGGARFDPSMSSERRKSFDNGIWLCANCSYKIDKDPTAYSVALLKEWKEKAENTAKEELGKKLPSNNQAIDTVTTALTGLPKGYIPTAVSNVHQATDKALELLDPRCSVKTSYLNGETRIGIYPKEDIPISIKVSAENAKEYIEKYQQLIEHGQDIEIKSSALTFEGSELFEEITNSIDGTLSMLTEKKPATQKLWLVQNETNETEQFDDIHGLISLGTKSFSFNGTACNDLFGIKYQKSLDENDDKAKMTISLSLEQWEGEELSYLPYFEKLLSLFSKIVEGWEVKTSLEIKGMEIFSGVLMKADKLDYITFLNGFLQYVNRCKIVSNAFNIPITFTTNISYTAEDHKRVADIAEIVEGRQVYKQADISNPICKLEVNKECENVKMLANMTEAIAIKMEMPSNEIELFGVIVPLPAKIITFLQVLPLFHSDIYGLREGDIVTVEWIPQKDFECSIRFES